MKKSIQKGIRITVASLLVLAMLACLAACGGGDALKGTWSCTDPDYGEVVWSFNGSGKCEMSHDFFESSGTYTIEGSNVSVTLEGWDSTVVYAFTVNDTTLTLEDTAGLALGGTLTKQ